MLSSEEMDLRFGTSKRRDPDGKSLARKHSDMRRHFKNFANHLNQTLPPGRSKALALNELEVVQMWAHKSIGSDEWDT